MTAPQIILSVLESKPEDYLAVHEITAIARGRGHYISDNAAASRLCIDLKGDVESRYRTGKRFKEWRINSDRRRFMDHERGRQSAERRIEAAENAREEAQESAGLDSLHGGAK